MTSLGGTVEKLRGKIIRVKKISWNFYQMYRMGILIMNVSICSKIRYAATMLIRNPILIPSIFFSRTCDIIL